MNSKVKVATLVVAFVMIFSSVMVAVTSAAPVPTLERHTRRYEVPVGPGALNEIVGGYIQTDLPWWVGEGLSGNRWLIDPIGHDTTMDADIVPEGIRFWRSPDSEFFNFAANPVMARRFGSADPATWQWIDADAPLIFDIDATVSTADADRQFNISAWPIWFVNDPSLDSDGVPIIINLNHWIRQYWTNFEEGGFMDPGRSNVRITHNASFRSLLEDLVAQGAHPFNEQHALAAQRALDVANANDGFMPIDRFMIMATVHHAGGIANFGPNNAAILREMSWGVDADTVHADEQRFLSRDELPPESDESPTSSLPVVSDTPSDPPISDNAESEAPESDEIVPETPESELPTSSETSESAAPAESLPTTTPAQSAAPTVSRASVGGESKGNGNVQTGVVAPLLAMVGFAVGAGGLAVGTKKRK